MESRSRDRKKSHTWKYFNEISSESVTCKLCAAVLKRTSGSTTSMLNHLERIHHLSLRHIKTQRELMAAVRGKTPTLKLKREAAIKAEKTMSKSTYEEEEEDEHLPKTGISKQDPNTSEVAMTEDGTAEQFEFQYELEGPTFKNENGECSKSHLSIIKVEQLDPLLPEQNNSSCGSGSPGDPGPPGSSGFGSSMSPAAQFFRKCHQAGCTQFIFSEFASRLNTITERISSQQASEEDFNLTLKVLEASGMLPEIFAKRDQEMEKRLKDLQREIEAVRTARSAMRDACVMNFTPS
ncbi:uncharacterized protein LOC118371173 isoform X1 [Oncorhynchus keta]|uniref:uncharacterized protein LOC118371173 isoform X1 n=2 Tax=Oncorhynchus keta TaxID=8018 RepID=UPI0015F7C0CF|nr:uncharacterized protein LOC118371173 isoform X1 [Oncorhynchus keta]